MTRDEDADGDLYNESSRIIGFGRQGLAGVSRNDLVGGLVQKLKVKVQFFFVLKLSRFLLSNRNRSCVVDKSGTWERERREKTS